MKIPFSQVDAFSSKAFGGNPAAICVLNSWLDNDMLQKIAAENNLSETAFLVPKSSGNVYCPKMAHCRPSGSLCN